MGFRTVFVKNGERLSLKLDNLEIFKNGESFIIPLSDIETIVLEGDRTVITTRLLAKVSRYHINVVICDNKFMPCGMYLGIGQYHRAAKRNMWQANWSESLRNNMWTSIVSQKIDNQINVARKLNVEESRIQLMEDMLENITFGDETNREGHVAKVYFNSLFGQGFSREDDTFPNHCLNYGYSIIRAQTARSVVALGLIPSLGIFHRNEYNAFNLVDDLMEPFRPILDYFIITSIDFNKNEYMTYDLRLHIIDFLNHQIKIKNKKFYMGQAIYDFVNSFIKVMKSGNFNNLLSISIENYIGSV